MASKNKQLVAFEVALTLPSGMSLQEAAAFINTSIIQGKQARPAADPASEISSESIKVKLLRRTVIYGG